MLWQQVQTLTKMKKLKNFLAMKLKLPLVMKILTSQDKQHSAWMVQTLKQHLKKRKFSITTL